MRNTKSNLVTKNSLDVTVISNTIELIESVETNGTKLLELVMTSIKQLDEKSTVEIDIIAD